MRNAALMSWCNRLVRGSPPSQGLTCATVCSANRAAATWHARLDRAATPHLRGCCSADRRSRQPWAVRGTCTPGEGRASVSSSSAAERPERSYLAPGLATWHVQKENL